MGTIYEKLNYLDGTKGLLREAINEKGGELTTNNTFREYVNAITNLSTDIKPIYFNFTESMTDENYGYVIPSGSGWTRDTNGLYFTSSYLGSCTFEFPPFSVCNLDITMNIKCVHEYLNGDTKCLFSFADNEGTTCLKFMDDTVNNRLMLYFGSYNLYNWAVGGEENIKIKISTKFLGRGNEPSGYPHCDIYINDNLVKSDLSIVSQFNYQFPNTMYLGKNNKYEHPRNVYIKNLLIQPKLLNE